MKANEAPKKVYIQPSVIEQLPHQNIVYTKPLADNSIEYIRTDAFIDKVCNAYCKVCKIHNCRKNDCKYLSDFINYMKGE